MATKLIQSPVVFNEEQHTYTLDGRQLSGITSIIHKYLFPDMYAGVSQATLTAAASRGSMIHKKIELLTKGELKANDLLKDEETEPVVKDYIKLIRENKIKMKYSEYLVSDNTNVASCIDIIDSDFNLYDIKTTYELNTEYVRWQLSIYAYLFEQQNPDIKVGKLFAVHLKNGARLVEVERISGEFVLQLLDAYAFDAEAFFNPLNTIGTDEEEVMTELQSVMAQKKELESREKILKGMVEERMIDRGAYSINVPDRWKVTRGLPTVSNKFDEERFKNEHPTLWAKYLKETESKGRMTFTFPKPKAQ